MLLTNRKEKLTKSFELPKILTGPALSWALVVALTGLAFMMRRKGLATQSLWFDEADLVARARRDLGAIMGDFLRPGENGPLYTFLMHFWLKVAGAGEAAIRTPSLIAGTLVVPMIYILGRRFLGGPAVGLVAAGLVAISPYQLWYSQDAKMYPLTLLLTMASVYLFLMALEKGGRGWWAAYVILTTLSFYIHLMSVLIVAVEVCYYLVMGVGRRKTEGGGRKFTIYPQWGRGRDLPPMGARPRFTIKKFKPQTSNLKPQTLAPDPQPSALSRRAAISLGLLTLPYLPIAAWQAIALWDGGVGKTWFRPVGLPEMLNTLGRRFGVNRIEDPIWETSGALFYAGLVVLGLYAAWRWASTTDYQSQKSYAAPYLLNPDPRPLLLTLYLALPIVAFYLLTMRIPLFAERYLLIASPAYYLLAAWGLVWLARRAWLVGLLAGGVALTFAIIALFSFNYAEAPQKEDWREAMRWLDGQIRPGDEVIVLPGYAQSAVDYYLKPGTDTPVFAFPQHLLDGKALRDLESYLLAENGILRDRERVWIIVSPERYASEDPTQYLRKTWFDYNTWMFQDPKVFLGVTIYGYSFKQFPGTNADFYPRSRDARTNLKFGDTLLLEGYDILPDAATNLPAGQVRYDSNLHLTLYWRKLIPDTTDYTVQVRLLDSAGQDTNTNYAAQPHFGYYPTGRWKTGEAVRDYRDLYIHVPPGQYQLEITVFPKDQPQSPLAVYGTQKGQKIEPETAQPALRLTAPVTIIAAR